MGELVLGPRWRWSVDLAVTGAALPLVYATVTGVCVGPPAAVLAVARQLLPLALAAGILGAVVGAGAPSFLERVRGRVPLPLLVVLWAFVGGAWALFAELASGAAHADPGGALFALLVGMVAGGLGFLPYTVAAVVRLPRSPVLLALLAVPLVLDLGLAFLFGVRS